MCARVGTAVSWPSVAGLAGRVVACLSTQAAKLASPLVAIHPIVLRYNSQLPSSFWSQYSLCIAIQCPQPSSLPQSQYTNVYCNTISPAARLPMSQYTAVYCDTNLNLLSHPLQYNFSSHYTLLQYNSSLLQYTYPAYPKLQYTSSHSKVMSRYKVFCHNTIWAVSQISSVPKKKNFIFHYYYYYFQLFPTTRKYQKNKYIPLFFLIFQNTQINL